MKKEIAVGISLLCIITSLPSSFNVIAVKASDDTPIAEVTTQVYGNKTFKDTTVKISKQQYRNLQLYLNNFQARLNTTTTREEVIILFTEAVAELDTYRLLPKGMNVTQAQKLISGDRCCVMGQNYLKKIRTIQDKNSKLSSDVINLFCYFYAHTALAFEDNIWGLLSILLRRCDVKIFSLFASLIYGYSQVKPLRFMNHIWVPGPGIPGITYSYFTIGLLGIHRGGDEFGDAFGFSGLKLILDGESEAVYIGFTLLARKNPHYLS